MNTQREQLTAVRNGQNRNPQGQGENDTEMKKITSSCYRGHHSRMGAINLAIESCEEAEASLAAAIKGHRPTAAIRRNTEEVRRQAKAIIDAARDPACKGYGWISFII